MMLNKQQFTIITKYDYFQYQKIMFPRNSNTYLDIQVQAKKTLAFFSDQDQNISQWESDIKTATCEKKKGARIHDPIRNMKYQRQHSRQQKKRLQMINNSSFGGRTLLIPCKVSLQNQENVILKKQQKSPYFRNPYLMVSKQNCKPYKTMRLAHSLAKQAQQKQEQQGIDLMQYWIKHRFQDGAINSLVERLKDKKNTTCMRF